MRIVLVTVVASWFDRVSAVTYLEKQYRITIFFLAGNRPALSITILSSAIPILYCIVSRPLVAIVNHCAVQALHLWHHRCKFYSGWPIRSRLIFFPRCSSQRAIILPSRNCCYASSFLLVEINCRVHRYSKCHSIQIRITSNPSSVLVQSSLIASRPTMPVFFLIS